MKDSIYIKVIVVVFLLISITGAFGQKKVKGLPDAFKAPKDLYDASGKYSSYDTRNKTKAVWVVFSDRDNNNVYEKPDLGSKVVRALNFREYFNVVDDEGSWIQIATAQNVQRNLKSDAIQIVGWVPKDKMLLWTSGLIDKKTSIDKKAFLLNRADDIKRVIELKKDAKALLVDIYSDPDAKRKEKEKNIYDFYFVFKKENGMLLLSEESNINIRNAKDKLLGWVRAARVEEWNTRISLEPNFNKEAFDERKSNRALGFKAFGKPSEVSNYIKNKDAKGLIWDNDPTKFKIGDMAKTNPMRFSGNVVRFPLFGKDQFDDIDYYKSGVIGYVKIGANGSGELTFDKEVSEQDAQKFKQLAIDQAYKSRNVNLFFIVEGTDKTFAFQQGIANMIRTLKTNEILGKAENVKYGALVYKDIPEKDQIIQYKKLTSNINKVADFVASTNFKNTYDQDDYTALYYGLNQSLKVAGFKEDELNIIFLIGSCGDFSVDDDRLDDAEKSGDKAYMKSKNKIFEDLATIGAHFYSIQLSHDGRMNTGTAYGVQSHLIISETAKYIHNKILKIKDKLDPNDELGLKKPPEIPFPIGSNKKVKLKNGKPSGILVPSRRQSLTREEIHFNVNEMINESMEHELLFEKVLHLLYIDGKAWNEVKEILEEGGIGTSEIPGYRIAEILPDGIDLKSFSDMLGAKLNLYTEVYLPIKLDGAQYPMSLFVLFMPEDDLLGYHRNIKRALPAGTLGTDPEKREALFNIYLNLVKRISGQERLKGKDIENLTRTDVFKMMQGIDKEGFEIAMDIDIKLGDIRDTKKVKSHKIDALFKRFTDVEKELGIIIKLAERYDFCLKSSNNNRYYWLRIDQVF